MGGRLCEGHCTFNPCPPYTILPVGLRQRQTFNDMWMVAGQGRNRLWQLVAIHVVYASRIAWLVVMHALMSGGLTGYLL